MLCTLTRHVEDTLHKRGFCCCEVSPLALVRFHDGIGELPGLGGTQHDRVPFDADPQPVILDNPVGERMIGGHGRIEVAESTGIGAGVPLLAQCLMEGGQPLPDAGAELPGGLAGERDTQNLFGPNQRVGNEPHHAVRHGLGLA